MAIYLCRTMHLQSPQTKILHDYEACYHLVRNDNVAMTEADGYLQLCVFGCADECLSFYWKKKTMFISVQIGLDV